MSAIPATPCVPPCVAMSPQAREMSRGAPGWQYCSPASPVRAFPPGWPCSSAGKRTGHPAPKTLGTATIPFHRSLPAERPVCRRAPNPERGTRCATKPNTMRTHGIPSQPSVSRGRGDGPKRPASSLGHPASTVPGSMYWPGSAATRPAGRIGRSFPRRQPGGGPGRRIRAPCRSTSSELICHAIPVSLTIEPKPPRW